MPVMLGGGSSEELSRCYLGSQLLVGGKCITPPNSILYYYKFQSDIKDYSGNGYDLTASGSYTQNDGYISLLGQDNRLYNNSSSLIITPNTKSYTIGCMLRNFYTGNECRYYQADAGVIATYFSGDPEGGMYDILGIANGYSQNTSVGYVMKGAIGTNYTNGDSGVNISVTGSTWKKIIVTWDKDAGTLKYYEDGVLKNTFTGRTAGSVSYNTGVMIGYRAYSSYCKEARFYIGDIKHVILSEGVREQSDFDRYLGLE